MELGAPSARNSCQISCALDATSCSGRRFRSCTANQNLQQRGLGGDVVSIAFQQLASKLCGRQQDLNTYFSSIQSVSRKPKPKEAKHTDYRPHRRFSELNSDSRNFRNWSRPTGSFSASSREKPHLFTRCWLGSRLPQRKGNKRIRAVVYRVRFSLRMGPGSFLKNPLVDSPCLHVPE